MNNKLISILVLTILVVGLSTIGAVAATDSGISQDKVMSLAICECIEMVKVVGTANGDVSDGNVASNTIIKKGNSIKGVPFVFKLPKPIIITPGAPTVIK